MAKKPHLSIGTATNRINLIDVTAQAVSEWEPSETPLADTFSESSLGDGRVLSSYREENAIENFRIHLVGSTSDTLLGRSRAIRNMLLLARNYWVQPHNASPVYLQARGACETNMRYALVYTGQLPSDNLPWGNAFARAGVIENRTLVIERGPWMNVPPGSGSCIEIAAGQNRCYPYHLVFDGVDDYVDCHSDAQLDDIPLGAIEVDAWINLTSWGDATDGAMIIGKSDTLPDIGWQFIVKDNVNVGLQANVIFATTDSYAASGQDEFNPTFGDWVYVYFCCDFYGVGAATKQVYLNINGVWVASYAASQQGVGAYTSDAALDVNIGKSNIVANPQYFDGKIGWVRVRDTMTRTVGADFTPPLRCAVPIPDASTMGLWIYEGTGGTTGNAGAGATAGDMEPAGPPYTGPAWGCDCPDYFGRDPDIVSPDPVVLDPGTKVDTFDSPIAAAPVTQEISGLGFKPQILFLWASYHNTVDGAVLPGVLNSLGMATLNSSDILYQAAVGWGAQDNLNPNPDTAMRQSNAHILSVIDHTQTVQLEATLVSFDDDGFTLRFTTNAIPGASSKLHYAALRSDHITDSMIRHWQHAVGLGNHAITGVGFQPDAYINFGGGINAAMPGQRNDYYWCLGTYDGTTQWASGVGSVHGGGLGGLAHSVQSTGSIIYVPLSAAVPSVRMRSGHVSLDADGFTYNCTTVPPALEYIHSLFMKGSNFKCGFFTQTGAGAQPVTGVGFQPDMVLLFHNGTVNGVAIGPPANPGFGACDENLNMAAAMSWDNRVNPTEADRWATSLHAICDMIATGAVRGAASVTSLDGDGFTLNWSTWTGGANHPVYYMAFKVS